ncbi:recombinase family protein [Lachnospiraceae bacterium 42-17]|jgi:DNA invertase Pin-like site-specific DNA recombinase
MQQRYAFVYIRVSTHDQEEVSPESQKKLLEEYAEKNNIIILKTFYELGVSGRKADKRPEFQKMISLCKTDEHPVDLILVWKFSRFARNQEESIVYKSLLKKQHRIDVVSVSEPLIEGPFGSLIERIIEWMDEYYSIRLSGEVLRGMKEKARQKGYQMVPPLGYQAAGGGRPFTINEKEYKIVSFMAEQFDTYDVDFTAIARKLNEMGCLSRRGSPFEARTVEHVLTNPFYYGLVSWKDITFMGNHEVRLTKECFDRRIQKIQQRHHPVKRRNISTCRHWLSGLLKCGYCGATLAYNGANIKCASFQCYRYSKGIHRESCCISEKRITEAVYNYFEFLLDGINPEFTYCPPELQEFGESLDSLTKEQKKLKTREQRIRLAYENGADTLEEYIESKARLKRAIEELESKIADFQTHTPSNSPSKHDVLSRVRTVYDIIRNPDVDYSIKGTLMRSLVEDIVYDKENGRIIFHLYIS